ncbi:zinc-ribbon domain-containing protein [Angelakisella massiliensis]|uniref:zinc-ribbon domain-containing protein n=1 Tax=Angelakisella massiliensis TaxID=1871018 RepID=UPI0024B274A0|nr:zinc-ribbon domain-containing protein [Angelakisella massiliensis]
MAKEWHPTKNIPLMPSDVLPGSEKKVWWQCPKGHEWIAEIRSRVTGSGCPICTNRKVLIGTNDLATLYPHLAKEWHPTKNGELMPDSVTCGSKRKVWWQCSKGHEWCVSVQSRVLNDTGCPVCAGRIIIPGENDLASHFPDIAKEWHSEKNNALLPSMVAPFCKLHVWWRCPFGHDYIATVESRTAKHSGCPYCAGKKVLPGFNDLATCQPQIAAQWHPSLNDSLTPQMVTAGSHKKAWWICAAGHVWKAAIYSRTGKQQRGCPVCAGVVSGKRKLRYEKMMAEIKHKG